MVDHTGTYSLDCREPCNVHVVSLYVRTLQQGNLGQLYSTIRRYSTLFLIIRNINSGSFNKAAASEGGKT